jgi:hypothetical protein
VVVRILDGQFPRAAAILDGVAADVLAHTAFPRGHWRKIASTNPLELVNKRIMRRRDVVGNLPDDESMIRLAGAVLLDQHDDSAIPERRYLSEESMARIDADPSRAPQPRCALRRLTSATGTKGHTPTSTTSRARPPRVRTASRRSHGVRLSVMRRRGVVRGRRAVRP